MRKHEEVIRAWLDGKDIQYKYKNGTKWLDTSKEVSVNPMTYNELMWRIKPELKQVDYQALIDAKLFVTLFSHRDSRVLTSRLADFDEYHMFIDKAEGGLGSMEFEKGLRQVTTTDTVYKLWKAGFSVETEGAYCNSLKEDLCIVILEGVREGYTL